MAEQMDIDRQDEGLENFYTRDVDANKTAYPSSQKV